jgi:hypothetical protein
MPRPGLLQRSRIRLASLFLPKQRRQFFRDALHGCIDCANEYDRASCPVWWDKAIKHGLEAGADHEEISRWLEDPMLRRLAGPHFAAMHEYMRNGLTASPAL